MTRALVRLGATAAMVVILWFGSAAILAVDRGLEFSDEGLYLLEAMPPTPVAAFGFPFGWHTGPLLRVVGSDVAAFRTLGAVIMALASIWLAVTCWRLGRLITSGVSIADAGRTSRASVPILAAAGASAAMIHYVGFVRTPGYNWLNVVGTVLAVTGVMRFLIGEWEGVGHRRVEGIVIAGAGVFLTVPAKPSTPLLFAAIIGLMLWRALHASRAARVILAIAGTASAAVLVAVLAGVWSPSFLRIFLRAGLAPAPLDSQSVVGAAIAFIRLPVLMFERPLMLLVLTPVVIVLLRRFGPLAGPLRRLAWSSAIVASVGALVAITAPTIVRGLVGLESGLVDVVMPGRGEVPMQGYVALLRDRMALVVAVGVLLSVVPWSIAARERRHAARERRHAALGAMAIVLSVPALGLLRTPGALLGGDPVSRWVGVDAGTTDALVALIVAGLILASLDSDAWWSPDRRMSDRSWGAAMGALRSSLPGGITLVIGVTAMAFATGFGSGHLPYRQAGLAAPLLASAAVLAVALARSPRVALAGLAGVTSVLALMASTAIADGRAAPYRTAPMDLQTVPTTLGRDESVLLLDPQSAGLISSLQIAAEGAGWTTGTTLFAVNAWPGTVPWVLGARVPDSVLPTLGYRTERFDYRLSDVDGPEVATGLDPDHPRTGPGRA